MHGLSDVNPSRIHLTVPRDNHPRGAGGDLYRLHRRVLLAEDVTEKDDLPVTTVARTIRDCLNAGTDPELLRRALEQAVAEGLVRPRDRAGLRAEIDGTTEGGRA